MDLKPNQRVKLKSGLPPNVIVNGIADKAAELVADPARHRVAIVVFDVPERHITSETDIDTDEVTEVTVPTIRVRAIEEVTGDDEQAAQRMLGRARERRQAADRHRALALFDTSLRGDE